MEKKLLPLGAQSFPSFKENNYIYVDKTEHIYRLLTGGRYYFLSRPRRFGKSLLISTVKEIFEGNRALFNGLWIEDKWNWSQTKPVVHFSFAIMSYRELGLEKAIKNELEACAKSFGIQLLSDDVSS